MYFQDEINLGRLRLTPGVRVDYTDLPNKPLLSPAVKNSPQDAFLRKHLYVHSFESAYQ